MNKEVEEAKEYLKKHIIPIVGKDGNIRMLLNEVLLNYIQELEESIHKERELAEAQTTYEVNKMWKEKIENKIEELSKVKGDLATYIATSERIKALQELLNEEE